MEGRRAAVLVVVAAVGVSGCGASASTGTGNGEPNLSDTQPTPGADPFILACEGDVGQRIEAHCDCIERKVGAAHANTSPGALAEIKDGNPPSGT